MSGPQINAGEIADWPILKVDYLTDPDKVAALLPPGIEPGAEPHVNLSIYQVAVPNVPEYGVFMTVDADYAARRASTPSAMASIRRARSSSAAT